MRIILFTLLSFCLSIPSELATQCSWYVEQCQNETVASGCNAHYALLSDCDGSTWTKENYWECVLERFNTVRSDLTKITQFMEACFYEEHKDLLTYSYYADRVPSKGVVGLDQSIFTFGDQPVHAGDRYSVGISLDWPDTITAVAPLPQDGCDTVDCSNVPNQAGGGFIDPFVVWHINLHACLLTETQTTCSIKFPADASVSALNLQGTQLKGMKGESFSPSLTLSEPGDYKLLGHIRYYVEGENSERVLWDIGITKQLTVGNATTTTRRADSGVGTAFSMMGTVLFLLGLM